MQALWPREVRQPTTVSTRRPWADQLFIAGVQHGVSKSEAPSVRRKVRTYAKYLIGRKAVDDQ